MLNRRMQILFDEETYQRLLELSRAQEVSIGELVRRAVREGYEKRFERKRELLKRFFRHKVKISPLKASDLIKEGRRFGE